MGAIISVVAVTMVTLHLTGAVNGTGQDDGERLTAVLTVLGVIIPATVSVIGFLARRQSDRQLEARSRDERERLRLDAAMRAGSLFAGTAESAADPAAVASGLLALTQLNRADLAVALLVDLWDSNGTSRVPTETAVLVLNSALTSADPNAQLIAAELLKRNSGRLNPCQSLHWPSSIDGRWDPSFGFKTKFLIVEALVDMTVRSDHTQNALRTVALRLYGFWKSDDNERVRGCIGRLIEALLPALENLRYNDFLQDPDPVHMEDFRDAAGAASPNPDGFFEKIVEKRSERLREWSQNCRVIDSSSGSLANAIGPRCDPDETVLTHSR